MANMMTWMERPIAFWQTTIGLKNLSKPQNLSKRQFVICHYWFAHPISCKLDKSLQKRLESE
jgi:predicted alpha-1,6-mannanase (GH76 family)